MKIKKVILLLVAFVALINLNKVHAQEVGIRFGDALGGRYAIDAVFTLGEFNRLHADIAFGDGVGIEVLWDFLYRPLGVEAFNWYVGAGVAMGFSDPFVLGAAGEIGLEYHFNGVPLALGADWRPVLVIIEETDFSTGGFGVNLRWVFN